MRYRSREPSTKGFAYRCVAAIKQELLAVACNGACRARPFPMLIPANSYLPMLSPKHGHETFQFMLLMSCMLAVAGCIVAAGDDGNCIKHLV